MEQEHTNKNTVKDSHIHAGKNVIIGDVHYHPSEGRKPPFVIKTSRLILWVLILMALVFVIYHFVIAPPIDIDVVPNYNPNGSVLEFTITNNSEKTININNLKITKLQGDGISISGSVNENIVPFLNIGNLEENESAALPLDISLEPEETSTLHVGTHQSTSCIILFTFYQNSTIVYENKTNIGQITD
jgi:hypothetical protein